MTKANATAKPAANDKQPARRGRPPLDKAPAESKKTGKSPAPPTFPPRAIFLPTLLPDPFGEASPELCWEWSHAPARVTLRLTQFGWNASALVDGEALRHFVADSLQDLREEVGAASDLPGSFAPMALPWVLAYEVAGF